MALFLVIQSVVLICTLAGKIEPLTKTLKFLQIGHRIKFKMASNQGQTIRKE